MSAARGALLAIALLWLPGAASCHPEDEFCGTDSELDPALCRALAEADRPSAPVGPARFGATEIEPLPPESLDRPAAHTTLLYLKLGFLHILPRGLDHILFVLALLLASCRIKPLVAQVSLFTLAHTVTLGLAASGTIGIEAAIVEPLIAASIAVVALENLVRLRRPERPLPGWRYAIVFGFGLFHGLGFAGVLLDLGIPSGHFLNALISFNLGVEAGQLVVVALAWLALYGIGPHRALNHRTGAVGASPLARPCSLLIALTGAWWTAERLLGP